MFSWTMLQKKTNIRSKNRKLVRYQLITDNVELINCFFLKQQIQLLLYQSKWRSTCLMDNNKVMAA